MDGEAIVTVSAAVVALTQLIKWVGLPERFGPISVLVISACGVALWGFAQALGFEQTQVWDYFSGYIAVATSAAGVFGFTRAATTGVQTIKASRTARTQAVTR